MRFFASAIVRLDLRDDGSDIQGYLAQLTNQRTVPNVFISELSHIRVCVFLILTPQCPDQKHVGGACDTSLSAIVC